jgi:hypothetical protein
MIARGAINGQRADPGSSATKTYCQRACVGRHTELQHGFVPPGVGQHSCLHCSDEEDYLPSASHMQPSREQCVSHCQVDVAEFCEHVRLLQAPVLSSARQGKGRTPQCAREADSSL